MNYLIKQFFLSSWRLASLLFLSLFAIGTFFFSSSVSEENLVVPTKADALAQFYKLPLYFEKNEGQIDTSVKFLSRGPGYTFYFTPKEIIMVLQKTLQEKKSPQSAVLKIQFVGANQPFPIKGLEEQKCKSNYFKGNDPLNWRTNISNYAKVQYEGLYPGIDAVFYGNQQQFEYDFCLAPGANPQHARLHLEGAKELAIDAGGNLRIMLEDGKEVQMLKPFVYQVVEGKKLSIESNFTLLAQNEIGFALGSYDQTKKVVIDPVLVYSTYLGGMNTESGLDIAIDSTGNAYVTGTTASADFPSTTNAFQTSLKGASDAFVTKFDVTGNSLNYSTYLGGSSSDSGAGIAIDSSGNAYITGSTSSTDFPITTNAFQQTYGGFLSDAFMTQLNDTGSSLLYSTFLGGLGIDKGLAIAVDSSGNAYIVGQTNSLLFPTSPNAFQKNYPAGNFNFTGFVTKINPSAMQAASLVYSTFLGGNTADIANNITVDSQGHAYIVGVTVSTNFPVTSGAFQTTLNSTVGSNAFVTKLNLTGSNLIYSTYLGGSISDTGTAIALNGNNAYVTGFTSSSDFPITPGAFQKTLNGAGSNPSNGFTDAFATQLNADGTGLVYSTFLGGSNDDSGNGIAVDSRGNAYIAGTTSSTNFPITTDAIQTTLNGTSNAFVSKLDPTGKNLLFSTYLGGNGSDIAWSINVDNSGNAYVVGTTSSSTFPTTPSAFQTSLKGASDAFVTKIATTTSTSLMLDVSPNPASTGEPVTLTASGLNFAATGTISFFDGTTLLGTSSVFHGGAQLLVDSFSPGIHSLTAVYSGDSQFAGSTSPVINLTVNSNPTLTTLTVSPNPVILGQSVVFTAMISPSSAPGTVTFFDGNLSLATEPLVAGTATFSTSHLSAGVHAIQASYSGASDFLPSISPIVDLNVITAEPPRNLKGFQKIQDFQLVNVLKWQAPIGGTQIISYIVFRNSLNNPIGTISNLQNLKFKDPHIKKGKNYTYYVVSVDSFGNTSLPAKIVIKSIVKKKRYRRS